MNTTQKTVTRGLIASLAIQCRDNEGNKGNFLFSGEKPDALDARCSPVFDTLTDFYTWRKTSGWKEYANRYVYEPKYTPISDDPNVYDPVTDSTP